MAHRGGSGVHFIELLWGAEHFVQLVGECADASGDRCTMFQQMIGIALFLSWNRADYEHRQS